MPYLKTKKVKLPKKSNKGDLPKTEEEWIRYVNELHWNGLNARRKFEFTWTLNFAYYLGYQSLKYDRRTATIQVPKSTERPLTINRIGAFIDARKAKLTRNRPMPKVIPNTNDKEDINAAKYSGHTLNHLWRKIDMEEHYESYITLGLVNGTSFMKTIWNPYDGDMIKQAKRGKDDELYVNENGEIEYEKIFMGEVCSKALSSFNIIPADESCQYVRDQPWIMERNWETQAYLEKMYPHLKGKLKQNPMDKTDYEKILDRLATPISSNIGSQLHRMTDSINSEILVKTLWIKPCQEYEDGLVAVVVGEHLAFIDVFPNDYGSNIYPFVKFTERTDGYHFWGQSTIERLMPIQKAFNRLRQKKLKNAYLMGNGKWLLPKGSQVIEDALTDMEGEIIEYNSSVPSPKQAEIAPLPNYINQLANELLMDFRDVGGQPESSFSPNPNITAGIAMQVSAEIQDQLLTPILRRLARSMERVAIQQLLIVNTEYIEPRKILIQGERNSFGVQWISNADLRFNTDIHIEVESMFPDFRGAKQQRLFDLYDRRIITDPKQFLECFRFGNFDKLVEDIEKEEDPVIIDIQEIKRGNKPPVTQWQDHFVYFKKLSDWIKSPEFLRLPPERKDLAIQVLQEHTQLLMQSLPNQGAVMGQQNQNSVGSQFGAINPVGQPGNQAF